MEVLLTKDYIYSLLKAKGIAKADFAKQIGVGRTNLDALLRAEKKDINVVIKMAEALGMTLEQLIGFEPSNFKIKGYIKVGEGLREISTEEDWFKAESESGVCTIPYYSSFDDACDEIGKFLRKAIKSKEAASLMGRVNGETVYNIAVIDDTDTDENRVSVIVGRKVVISILTSTGMETRIYPTLEYEGDMDYMFGEIKGEIQSLFLNKNE